MYLARESSSAVRSIVCCMGGCTVEGFGKCSLHNAYEAVGLEFQAWGLFSKLLVVPQLHNAS